MADIFIFGILQRRAGSRPSPNAADAMWKLRIPFFTSAPIQSPEFLSRVSFFAMIVIEGNKLLMSDLFRVSYTGWTGR